MKKPVFRRTSAVETESAGDEQADSAAPDTEDSSDDLNGADSNGESSGEQGENQFTDSAAEAVKAPPQETAKAQPGDLQRLQAEAKDNYDKYIRTAADLENFKKRAIRERADLLKYAEENLARDLLEIIDNFGLALAQIPENSNDEFVKGVKMIHDRFISIMDKHSVRGESSLGQMFDPFKQQALASVPTADSPPGTILEEYKRAYYLKDKLLRPGQVVVASAPAESSPEPTGASNENTDAGKNE